MRLLLDKSVYGILERESNKILKVLHFNGKHG